MPKECQSMGARSGKTSRFRLNSIRACSLVSGLLSSWIHVYTCVCKISREKTENYISSNPIPRLPFPDPHSHTPFPDSHSQTPIQLFFFVPSVRASSVIKEQLPTSASFQAPIFFSRTVSCKNLGEGQGTRLGHH